MVYWLISDLAPNKSEKLEFRKTLIYGRYYEMPQKACERYIFHVMAYAIFFEMPHFIFGSFSLLKLITCILFEMPRFLMFIFLKCPIFPI